MSNLNGPLRPKRSVYASIGRVIRVAALSFAATAAALAGVVYDSGPAEFNGAGWYLTDPGKSSQQFNLTDPAQLTSFTFATMRYQFGPGATLVNWEISQEPKGEKSITKGTSAVSNAYLGFSPVGYVYFAATASLPDVVLSAGSYWLTLQTDRASDGAALSAPVRYASGGNIRSSPCCDVWYEAWMTAGQLPLQISGIAPQSNVTTVTPEPSTWGMLGASLAGATLFRRRRR